MAIMSSVCLASTLPPTCNLLDAGQRSRLIKTTRKLGKMLGATPVVVADSSDASPSVECVISDERNTSSLDLSYPGISKIKGTTLTRSRSLSQASQSSSESASSSTLPFFDREVQSQDDHRCGSYTPITTSFSKNALLAHYKHQQTAFAASRPSLNITDRKLSSGNSDNPAGASSQQPILRLPSALGHGHTISLPVPIHTTFCDSKSLVSSTPTSPTYSPSDPFSSALSSSSSGSTAEFQSPMDQDEPLSPLFDEPLDLDEARIRKRRMDKLMRHLGECIPSELVFGSSTSPNVSRPASPAPSAFAQTPMMTQVTHTTVSPPSTISPPSLSRKLSRLPPSEEDIPQHLVPTTRTERRTSVSIVSSSALSLGRMSSLGPFTYRKQFELPAPDIPSRHSLHTDPVSSETHNLRMRSGAEATMDCVPEEPRQDGPGGVDEENDWNAEAYQDVVKRLRALKR